MAEILTLKSRLLREADPWQVDLSSFYVSLEVDQQLYQRDLQNFLRRFAVTEDAADVAAQDMVTLRCVSENKRFNKDHITIRVGLGLFSRELENQLLGWKKGQRGTVTVKEQPVEVTVESIRRETLPEVDDALAARCGISGIHTAEDIHAYCKGKQLEEALEEPADEAFTHLMREVCAASEFALDPEETAISRERMAEEMKHNSIFSLPEDTFLEQFGCSKEDMMEQMRNSGEAVLKSALLGQAMLERAGKLATSDDYEAYLARFLAAGDKTLEQLRKEKPILNYLVDTYSDYFMNEMEELALRRLEAAAV